MAVEPAALLLRSIGLFYAIAGFVAMRAMVMDRLMDRMLAAIAARPLSPQERLRHALLGGGAVLTGVGGVALLVLHVLALPLMLANIAVQALWLIQARAHFPPGDADAARGRRQTIHAFLVYLAASVIVVACVIGAAVPLDASGPAALALLALLAGAMVWQFQRGRLPQRGPVFDAPAMAPPDDAAVMDGPAPRYLCLAPFPGDWPIYDGDTGVRIKPEALGLPEALVQRIVAFEAAVLAATDVDYPDGPTVTDGATYDRLAAEAQAIVTAMEGVLAPADDPDLPPPSVAWQLPGH